MEQRLSLITLGISDLDRARRFYEALGWKTGAAAGCCAGAMGALPRAVPAGGGGVGVTLAYNTRSTEEVDEVIEEARKAGATIGREPGETFWGGYSGVFIDPDGYPWEVAHHPRWTLEEDGSLTIPKD